MSAQTVEGAAATIRPSTFWAMLRSTEQAELRHDGIERAFPGQGYMLAAEGTPVTSVIVLLQGFAKAIAISQEGLAVVLRVYGPGDIIGCNFLRPDCVRTESVRTLTRGRAVTIPVDQFTKLLNRSVNASSALLTVMQQRVQAADLRAVGRRCSPEIRIAQLLLELADAYGLHTLFTIEIPVPLSQSELASWIGDSRETVARVLLLWRKQGLVRTSYRRISIVDRAGLSQLAAAR